MLLPLQVWALDLGRTATAVPPTWRQVATRGLAPSARSRCAIALLPGGRLLLHGGMLCSPSVQGVLSGDAYCLHLLEGMWEKLQPEAPQRAFGGAVLNAPRVSHAAAAVPAARSMLLLGGTSSLAARAASTSVECLQLVHDSGPCATHALVAARPAAQTSATAAAHGLAATHDLR